MEPASLVELAGKTGLELVTPDGEDAPGPAVRQIVVQDDQAPDHPEHGIQSVTTHSEGGIARFEPAREPLDQQSPATLGEVAAGVDRGIRHELDRIVPAEILEIDETQLTVLAAQCVVQPEIRWTQGTARRRKRGSRIPP